MSRNKKRGQKRSPAVESPKSAALVSQEARVPAKGGGPVSRPAWAPGDVDLLKVPESVRQAVAEVVEPAYQKLVAEVQDPLERSIGLTLVHLMWLEVLDQHETKHEYLETSVAELPEDRSGMIDRHLRMLNTKVKVGSFLVRLREIRRQAEADTPQKVQGAMGPSPGTAARLGGTTEGKCGKRETCHPKLGGWKLDAGSLREEAAGDKDQVSVAAADVTQDADRAYVARERAETRGECGKPENCHPKLGSWELGTRSRGGKGGSGPVDS